MAFYKIEIKRPAQKAIQRLDTNRRSRAINLIQKLKTNPRPRGCEKLKGSKNSYRIRFGDHRIVYTIWDDRLIIMVIKIGHRKEIYRNL